MKASSSKNKGRRFENYLQEVFRRELDSEAHVNKGSGAGLNKGDLRIPSLNMVVEAKNAAQVNLIKDWGQAKEQAFADDIPILAIRNPKLAEFKETLIVMDLGTFCELAKGNNDAPVQFEMTWEDRRRFETAVRALKDVLNHVPSI